MMTLLLPLGLASSTVNAVAAPSHAAPSALLHCANWPTEQLAQLIDARVTAFAHPAWATLPVSPPSWAEVALIALLLLVASLPSVVRRRPLSLPIVALPLLVLP